MTAVQMTKQGKEWINPSQRFATAFATDMRVWATVGLRLRFGQHHKSLIDKHKCFLNNSLQSYGKDF
jgi:hypothetical protein